MIDTVILNAVDLYSEGSDDLFDILFSKSIDYVNFNKEEIVSHIYNNIESNLEKYEGYDNIIIVLSAFPKNNWKDNKGYNEIMYAVDNDILNINGPHLDNSLLSVTKRLSNNYFVIQPEFADYEDFIKIANRKIGKLFFKKESNKYLNFIDTSVYFSENCVINNINDIPEYVVDQVSTELNINGII